MQCHPSLASSHIWYIFARCAKMQAKCERAADWLKFLMISVVATFMSNMSNASKKDYAISRDPEVMGGMPVFCGTRVPFETLIDYLVAGHPLGEFLKDFPTVSIEQAIQALEQAS